MQDTTVRAGLQPSTDPYDEDPELVTYLLPLWRWRWLILGVSVLCAVAMFAVGKRSPRIYEASVKMVVTAPKTTQVGEVPPAVSIATFRAMIDNQALAAQVVKEFRLDAAPMSLTPHRFLAGALVIETPRDTNVLVLRVRLANPDLPAKVANRLAELATSLAERLNQEETGRTRDYIKAQVDQSRVRLEAAEARLGEFRQEAQIEALKKDVEAELGERANLLPLLIEIETERAKLAKAEEELAKRQPIGTVKRTIDKDPALMEAARETAGSASAVLGLEMRDEYPSKVYEVLDQQVAESRTKLSGLEKKRTELVDIRKLASSQLTKLNLLYSRESQLARLDTESELAKKTYLEVATRYEQARLQVAGRTAQLQLLDPAIPSNQPVGPRVLRNTAAAGGLSFFLCVMAVLFLHVVSGLRGTAQGNRRTKEAAQA